jgi:hypothetical protein
MLKTASSAMALTWYKEFESKIGRVIALWMCVMD